MLLAVRHAIPLRNFRRGQGAGRWALYDKSGLGRSLRKSTTCPNQAEVVGTSGHQTKGKWAIETVIRASHDWTTRSRPRQYGREHGKDQADGHGNIPDMEASVCPGTDIAKEPRSPEKYRSRFRPRSSLGGPRPLARMGEAGSQSQYSVRTRPGRTR